MSARIDNSKDAIPVWLLEPHPLATRYLQGVLRREPSFSVLTNMQLLSRQSALTVRPSVFVIDCEFLSDSLGGYLESLRSSFPQARILILGSAVQKEELCRLMLLGIRGFISYDEVDKGLVAAVRRISEGHMNVSPDILEQFADYVSRISQEKRRARMTFSSREKTTLSLLQQNLSNKEIGSALGISERTVKFHLSNIFDKLGVRDRYSVAEIVRRLSAADESK